jgi:hypothetical protein
MTTAVTSCWPISSGLGAPSSLWLVSMAMLCTRAGRPPWYSTPTWTLASGSSQGRSCFREGSSSRRASWWAISTGSGIRLAVWSQA